MMAVAVGRGNDEIGGGGSRRNYLVTCGILTTRKSFLTWETGRVMMADKQVSEGRRR